MFTSNTEADSNERTGLAVTDETAAIEFLDDYNDKVRDYNEVVVSRHFAYFTHSTQENYALLVSIFEYCFEISCNHVLYT